MAYGTVQIGRLADEEMKTVAFENGETVAQMLEKAGLSVDENESVKLADGTAVATSTRVADGERYFITSNYKNGNQ